ncbi:MAG: hypothetical protein IT427_19040 [Pirellulales bacterium]|nr:hypothetical protein [Pirellulales bacterium]
MDWKCLSYAAVASIVASSSAISIRAQQVTVGAPIVGVSDGFHENFGVGFGIRLPGGVALTNGGPVGIGVGAGLHLGGPNGFLNIVADQGSNRGMSMVAPSVTVMSGGAGSISDVTWRPFVIGFMPVVGGLADPAFSQFGPMPIVAIDEPSILEERWERLQQSSGLTGLAAGKSAHNNTPAAADTKPPHDLRAARLAAARASTAGQPTQSIVAIRQNLRDEAAAQASKIAELLDRARRVENENNPGLARIYYQQALKRSAGQQRDEIEAHLHRLGNAAKSR